MELILGIDQGGTKTHAVVSDMNGNILGVGIAPGGYHSITGMDYAMAQIKSASNEALKNAQLPQDSKILAVGAGLTGADFPHEYAILTDELQKLYLDSKINVVNDCMIALRAGSSSPYSAVICSGTGTNCAVCAEDGREFIFGYYIESRWQGGGAIAMEALMKVFESDIGMQPKTMLTEVVLEQLEMRDIQSLMQGWYEQQFDRGQVKHLARAVDELAAKGDTVACNILKDFGSAWGNYAVGGIRYLNLLDKPVDVVLSGSIFKSATTILRESVYNEILQHCPSATISDAKYEPVMGGVILAIEKMCGSFAVQEVRPAIDRSAKLHGLIRNARIDITN